VQFNAHPVRAACRLAQHLHRPTDQVLRPIQFWHIAEKLGVALVPSGQRLKRQPRLLRLPGTHNSKNGEWTEVVVEVNQPTRRYELDDLRDWLELAPQPLLHRRERAGNGQSPDNPFLMIARRQGFKPPIDVEARLAAMQYQGPEETGIHRTQLAVSASLLNQGLAVDEVVTLLLEATHVAAGEAGQKWNWRREERELRGMCEAWQKKHPEIAAKATVAEGAAEPAPPPLEPPSGSTEPPASAPPGPSAGSAGASTASGPSVSVSASPRKAGKLKRAQLAVILADGVIAAIRRDGGDLLLTEGDLHFYRDGLWSPADDAIEQRLRVLIQQGADTLGEADTKILSAAWKRLKEHPALYRAHIDWDAAGKVCLTNGVLDLTSRAFTSWAPEHYLRRKLAVAYDPAATDIPRITEFIAGLFPGRPDIIELLQEFAGAALCVRLLHREQRRALWLIGASRTGKSELGRLLGHPFGPSVVAPTVRDLEEPFGLEVFYRATAWVCDDAANEGDKLNPQRFKTVVTGEPINIRRKYKGAIRIELAIPVVLTANALPAARDASDAVFNRSLVVDMTHVFDDAAAIAFRRKLGVPLSERWLSDWLFRQEGPGFLNWALVGLDRLLERGGFKIPEEVENAILDFKDQGSFVSEFARVALGPDARIRITRTDLVCAFHGWLKAEEGDNAKLYGARWLIPKLRIACPWITHYTGDGGVRYLGGAQMTTQGLDHWETQHNAAAQDGRGARGSSTQRKGVNDPWSTEKEKAEEKKARK